MSKILLYNFEINDYEPVIHNRNECAHLVNNFCTNEKSDKFCKKTYNCSNCTYFMKEGDKI